MTDDRKESPAPGDARQGPSKDKMPADWNEALDGEWNDEFLSEQALADGADIELLIEYLNKHLGPERREQVKKRLEVDEAFRELAAPLILAWSIPKHLERHPRPPGELEASWEKFTKRHGFSNQRRKTKRKRFGFLALALIAAIAGFLARAPFLEWYRLQRDFVQVPHDTGWIPLGDSTFVQLAPGASLRAAREPVNQVLPLILDGSATFRVLALDSATPTPRRSGLVVHTRGGLVSAGESEFSVTARADTTQVAVQRPSRRRFFLFIPLPTGVEVRRDSTRGPMMLRELGRARLVRGERPQRLPDTKEP